MSNRSHTTSPEKAASADAVSARNEGRAIPSPPRYALPPAPHLELRRENPLHLPLFPHVPSLVYKLLHSHYFSPEDWDRWFAFYGLSTRFDVTCDLFRNIEYLYTEKELELEASCRVLDIGTGASVFPCHLRRSSPIHLTILDLDDYGFEAQRKYAAEEGLDAPVLVRGDATHPPFAAGSFDRIAAVSAIEHFPEDGDIRFLEAAWKLLRPGGVCVVTVPYATTYGEKPDVHHYHGGFERRYNREALKSRLWSTGGWRVERELYMNPADTPLARKLTLRHGRLDYFFDKWYECRANLLYSHDSLWYTLLLIDLSDAPGEGCFGSCFTLRRPEE